MRFAATIGSYELSQFVEACACYIRHVFGPDTPVLISDDVSDRSPEIQAVAEKRGCHYWRSSGRMNHFAGDMQAIMNSISFARQEGADIAIKISQRFWVLSPKIKEVAESIFADPAISLALPGRPLKEQIIGEKSFHGFPYLSDILFMRARDFEPDTMRVYYQTKFRHGQKMWDCFVETMMMDLCAKQYQNAHKIFNELTEVAPGEPLFLRRYCTTPQQFAKAAAKFGISGHFPTGAWGKMQTKYDPRPKA